MELFKIIVSLLFFIAAVYFTVKSIEKLREFKAILIRLVSIILLALTFLFVIDIIVFHKQHSMRVESRDKILQMVGLIVAGLAAVSFYSDKK